MASQQSNVNDLMNFGAKAWDSVFTPAAMSAPVRLPPPNYSTVQSIPQFNDPFAPRPPIVDPFGAQPYMIDPFGPVAQKPATGPGPQSVYGLQQPFAPSNQPYSLQQPQFGYSQPQFGFPRPTQPAAQASSNFNPFKTDVQQTTFGTGLHTSNSASSLNATANVNWNNQPAAAAPSAKPLHDPFASLIASPPVINKPSPIGPAVKPLAPPPSASANQHSALNNVGVCLWLIDCFALLHPAISQSKLSYNEHALALRLKRLLMIILFDLLILKKQNKKSTNIFMVENDQE